MVVATGDQDDGMLGATVIGPVEGMEDLRLFLGDTPDLVAITEIGAFGGKGGEFSVRLQVEAVIDRNLDPNQ